jgi:hypothetical protein
MARRKRRHHGLLEAFADLAAAILEIIFSPK